MGAWIWAVVLVGATGAGLMLLGFGAIFALCRWLDKHDLVISKRDHTGQPTWWVEQPGPKP